jgi:hypothetical protein
VVCCLPGFLGEYEGETDVHGRSGKRKRGKRLLKALKSSLAGQLKMAFAIEIKH